MVESNKLWSNETFLQKLKIGFPEYEKHYSICSEYKGQNTLIRVFKDGWYYNMFPSSLIKGILPHPTVVENPMEYFLHRLKEKHPNTYHNYIISGSYKNCDINVFVNTNYGMCSLTPYALLNGKMPSIKSALNKTEYWISMAKEKHSNFYTYYKTIYKTNNTPVIITCPIHGDFELIPSNHLNKRGCQECAKELKGWTDSKWKAQAIKAGRENFCKVYIIKCTSKTSDETFYKIGKTFTELKVRFQKKTPFTYEIIKEIYGEAKYICKLERKYHKAFKRYKYIPKLKFKGHTECFQW